MNNIDNSHQVLVMTIYQKKKNTSCVFVYITDAFFKKHSFFNLSILLYYYDLHPRLNISIIVLYILSPILFIFYNFTS